MSKSYLPPLKSLQYFLSAAQLNSFKLAAQELNVTQAAISQQIKVLEAYFGFTLFIRKTRSTELSEQGRKLLPYIEQGFKHLYAGVKQLSGDPNPNILRITAINSFTSIWLLPRLYKFQAKHPHLMVQIAPSNEIVDFDKGEIDLAIRMGRGIYKGLIAKEVIQDDLVLLASPMLISKKQADDPSNVFALPWIEDTSFDVTEVFTTLCAQYAVDRSTIIPLLKSNNSVTIIENIMQGRGIGLVNRKLVSEHIESGRLLTLLGFTHKNAFSMYLVAPEQNFAWGKVQLFEQWFVQQLSDSYGEIDKAND